MVSRGWQNADAVGLTLHVAGSIWARRHASQRRTVLAAVGVLVLVSACGSDNNSSTHGPLFGGRSNSSGPPAASAPTELLKAPPGTDHAAITAAADIVRARLSRMGVTDAIVTAQADGVDVRSSADPYQLHAAAQQHATTIAAITSTAVGPCNGPGAGSTGAAVRCYVLGPTLTGVTPVSNPAVQAASGAGWKLTVAIDPTEYKAFRAGLAGGGTGPLALVADGSVVLAFGSGVPAVQSAIGPPLAEDQARQAAAALAVDAELPVALAPPALPTPPGARVDLDFWTAAVGVKICGAWLANAPASGLDTGVHSHGDGLVYIHPFNQGEAGDKATLGLFLKRGGWHASADQLSLWDGDEHRSGTTCPNGQTAQVRWWVDGAEQQGDPSTFTPRNGQAIVLSFDSDIAPPGPPPQMSGLYLPPLGAATT